MAAGSGTSREQPGRDSDLNNLIHSQAADDLRAAAADPRLTEDFALTLLGRRDLSSSALEALASNASVMKHRRVIVGLVAHPRTPRYVSLPIARRLYTFELMKIALLPAIHADLRLAIEEAMVARLETVSAGERLSLARQGSTRVAAALLSDSEPRVMRAALENARLTEAYVVRAIVRDESGAQLIQAICAHSRWSLRKEVQLALLRNEHTPLAKAVQFARTLPTPTLREVLKNSRLSSQIKGYLSREVERRKR